MNSLAYIGKVIALAPIAGADRVELAEGVYPNGKQREGIVVQPTTETQVDTEDGPRRLSFRVLNLLYKH